MAADIGQQLTTHFQADFIAPHIGDSIDAATGNRMSLVRSQESAREISPNSIINSSDGSATRGEPRRFYARPADRSFEVYKAFLECMAESLGIAQDLSEDELRRGWQKFCEAADGDTGSTGSNDV